MIHNHILLQLYFSSGMIQNALPPAGWNDQDYPTLLALLSCLPSSLQIIHLVSEVSWCNKEGALGEVMNIPPHHPILCCDLINWWSTLCIVVSYRMIGMRSPFLVCSSPGLWRSQVLDCSKCSPTKAFAPSYLSWRHSDCQTSLFPTCNVN